MATCHLGISAFDFYDLTPYELWLMFEEYAEKYRNDIEMASLATRIALINVHNRKNHKVFPKEKKEPQTVDPTEKKKTLKELREIFACPYPGGEKDGIVS